MAVGRLREIMKKYGKVAIGVHCAVSAASITGLFIAVKNNVDVESVLEKVHFGVVNDDASASSEVSSEKPRNRTAELAASSGGAFALALLLNKALFPIRVPITIALTPPLSRFLARRNHIKSGF